MHRLLSRSQQSCSSLKRATVCAPVVAPPRNLTAARNMSTVERKLYNRPAQATGVDSNALNAAVAKSLVSYPNTRVTTLPNGLRVATERGFGETATVGFWVDCGSRHEDATTRCAICSITCVHRLRSTGHKAADTTRFRAGGRELGWTLECVHVARANSLLWQSVQKRRAQGALSAALLAPFDLFLAAVCGHSGGHHAEQVCSFQLRKSTNDSCACAVSILRTRLKRSAARFCAK